jgi:hypothetical protein
VKKEVLFAVAKVSTLEVETEGWARKPPNASTLNLKALFHYGAIPGGHSSCCGSASTISYQGALKPTKMCSPGPTSGYYFGDLSGIAENKRGAALPAKAPFFSR